MKKKKPAISKVFLKNAARGLVKCIPAALCGPFIEQSIFGTIDDEAAKTQAADFRTKIDQIITEQSDQGFNIARVIVALHSQYDDVQELKP